MGRSFAICALAIVVLAAVTAPVGSGGLEREPADGLLVLGVVGSDRGTRAVTREEVVVADPRTGATRRRRLPGGTLCHGPVLAVGDRVVFAGYRGRRPVALSLPLTLDGTPRLAGEADMVAPAREGSRTLSPDGRRVATGVTINGRPRVALRDRRSGRRTIVAGGRLAGSRSIAWSPASRWLYFTGGGRHLLAFRYGGKRAVPLPIEPGGRVLSIATG